MQQPLMQCKVSSWWRITLSMQQRRWEHKGKETKSCLKLGKREERWGKMGRWWTMKVHDIHDRYGLHMTSSNFTWHTTNAIGDRVLIGSLHRLAPGGMSPLEFISFLDEEIDEQVPVAVTRLTRLTRLVVSECFRVVLESKRTHFIYFSSLQFPQEIFSIFIHHFWYFPASHCHPLVFKVVPKRGEFDRTCAKVFRVTTLKVGGRPVEAQQPAPVRLRVAMKIHEGPWRSMNHKEHIGKHTDTNSIESW